MQKNISFSSLSLGLKNGKFFLALKNKLVKESKCYSEKELKPDVWYHMGVRVNQEPETDFHSVSLFVNGYMDLQCQVAFYEPFDNA
eukprot:CAMPEP_0202959634 /NCGR_PEP_ID=MMETSP1396-20130829/3813_1 /ASSEMBLY_ACC=CAM_ASM_000872 /TAXON_ID= /ORGANISM="Pseudokeronopsis sp., Strain Brazil" /LENGTH=85 /DNA_ID=CAMNT_0049678305 /DNA_START=180 /DNA_END=437 /DNA_ORIENTATION=-